MTTIRRMEADDADAVRQVEAAAFGAWLRQARGREEALPPRTRTNVLVTREKDPDGCFVAEDEGRVVGFVFSRTWGSVGWFGTFGVLPERQGCGIGRRLIAASLDYLRREPERTIGLETMPDSPYNLGLYLRLGFRVRFLTLQLSKTLDPSLGDGEELQLACWSELDAGIRERRLADLREATDRILPGLDRAKEIVSAARHGLGETVLLVDGARAVGASTVRLVRRREGLEDDRAVAQPVVLHPAHTSEEAFRALLEGSEALARGRGKREMVVPVNARHTWALERALRWGYRVKAASVRMVLAGTDGGPCADDHVNLARWAG
jgi:ribosomal protein S18 acetylase RimI-like enzyme